MKMTDKNHIKRFAKRMGLETISWTHPKFICDSALKHGAVESVGLHYEKFELDVNFELDNKGKLIGISTSSRDSFRRVKNDS